MGRVLRLLAIALLPACASPPPAATAPPGHAAPAASAAGIGTLAPAFRNYRIGTRRSDGGACTLSAGDLRYAEVLDLLDAPAVVLGLDPSGCIAEVRTAVTGVFEHAVALATQRLGPRDGEGRSACEGAGTPIQWVYWDQPEGRFCVVRAGVPGQPEFVLQAAGAPPATRPLCGEAGGR